MVLFSFFPHSSPTIPSSSKHQLHKAEILFSPDLLLFLLFIRSQIQTSACLSFQLCAFLKSVKVFLTKKDGTSWMRRSFQEFNFNTKLKSTSNNDSREKIKRTIRITDCWWLLVSGRVVTNWKWLWSTIWAASLWSQVLISTTLLNTVLQTPHHTLTLSSDKTISKTIFIKY